MATRKVRFLIDHIDPLGQGVHKQDGHIFFIPKTLPGETGVAQILKSKKNIHFCAPLEIEQKSRERVWPACPHFNECPGCHFLHTSYEKELEFKKASFHRMLAPLGSPAFDTVSAPARTGYRNRIQLHYDKKAQKLGFMDGKRSQISDASQCLLPKPELAQAKETLYKTWRARAQGRKGHVEIYQKKGGETKISWNKSYAEGGFTQVNEEMNLKMKETIREWLKDIPCKSALDLFGGEGNLAQCLPEKANTIHVDLYDDSSDKDAKFVSLNLFEEDSLNLFQKKHCSEDQDIFLVDPPRAGFRQLNAWIKAFRPSYLLYVSCHPQTMVRDLIEIQDNAETLQMALLDLFPSTYHFEAAALLHLR